MLELISFDEVVFSEDELRIIKKTYLEDQVGLAPSNIWFDIESTGHNRQAKYEQLNIFPEKNTSEQFKTPKPIKFIRKILSLSTDKDSIILDSFAGSGTTAQAVLELNKEDGGNRKFILVEQENYADNITAERVRRVVKGIPGSKNETLKSGLGGTFSYFELGAPIEMESILRGDNLPTYEEFARYIFYTATGQEFDPSVVNTETGFIGETKNYELYMFYQPDIEWLKRNALTLDGIKQMPKFKGKQRQVFAPAKFVDDETCDYNRISFCQLPYEIYRLQK